MATANINDVASIRRVYPEEAFARDAAENARSDAAVLKGIRITAAPDAAGNFQVETASRQTGEVPGAVFLAPFRGASRGEDYDAFIVDVVEAAQSSGYRADISPGPGDMRIRGARQ